MIIKKAIRFWAALPIALCLLLATTAAALATPAHGFSVQAIIPENQIDKKQTYYDLLMEPGQRQTLQLTIDNSSSSDIQAHVALNTASTGRNGTVLYNTSRDPDDSMKLNLADIAQVLEPEVMVPAKGNATVNIQVEMPRHEIHDGILLGGVVVTADNANPAEEIAQPTGLSIETAYEYAVGLKITQTDTPIRPDFQLQSVEPGLVNHRTALVINLQNSEAALAKNMEVLAQVYRLGNDEVFRQLHLDSAEMAPNSNGDYVVDWQSALERGDYNLYLRVDHEGETWEWNHPFQIDGQTAGSVNNDAVNIVRRPTGLYITLGLIGLALILWLAFWIGRRSRRV